MGTDSGYDTRALRQGTPGAEGTPHVERKQLSAIDGRTTTHDWYRMRQRTRKRIEEVFGWVKMVEGDRKLRYSGVVRNRLWVDLTVAGYNLVRLAKLTVAADRVEGRARPDRHR